jgi:hypothetical protein
MDVFGGGVLVVQPRFLGHPDVNRIRRGQRLGVLEVARVSDVPAWVALLTTFVGGTGVKLLDRLIGAKRRRREGDFEFAEQLRDEMRAEMRVLKDDVANQRRELDEWRQRYYVLRDAYNVVRNRCKDLYAKLQFIERRVPGAAQLPGIPAAAEAGPGDTIDALQFDDRAMRAMDKELDEEQSHKADDADEI